MAHRLPPAGIRTTPSEVFRFYEVRGCPNTVLATTRDIGCRQQPKYQTCPVLRCSCKSIKPDPCSNGTISKECAHLLPPAGMASERSDMFRFNLVHAAQRNGDSTAQKTARSSQASCRCGCKCCYLAKKQNECPRTPAAEDTVCCCEVACKCPCECCCERREVKRLHCCPPPPPPPPPPPQIILCYSDSSEDECPPSDECPQDEVMFLAVRSRSMK